MTIAPEDHPSAVIQVSSGIPGESKRTIPCVFNGMHGKRLLLETQEPLGIRTTASVEFNDAMFLGEVVACNKTTSRCWDIELMVEHVLSGLQSLMALRAQLLGEPASSAPQMAAVYARRN